MVAVGLVGHNAHAAIAFDNATSTSTPPQTSVTIPLAVTTTSANRILFVGVSTGSASVSSVTYNGQSLTLIGSDHETYNNTYAYLYYLIAPDTGTHNVVVTLPGSNGIRVTAASYAGASQIGVPDASTTSNGQGTTYSQSLTTGADNSWAIMMATNGDGRATGVGSGTTLRGEIAGAGGLLVDSNGPVSPAGSKTLNVVGTQSNDHWSVVMASFKP